MTVKWRCSVGLVLGLLVAGLVVTVVSLANRPTLPGWTEFRAIRMGMTRAEVRQLMQGAGLVLYTEVSSAEIMHVDGQTMIAVVYEPNPSGESVGVNRAGPIQADWVVKERMFVELGRGDQVDHLLVTLGIRSPRVVARDRQPR